MTELGIPVHMVLHAVIGADAVDEVEDRTSRVPLSFPEIAKPGRTREIGLVGGRRP